MKLLNSNKYSLFGERENLFLKVLYTGYNLCDFQYEPKNSVIL